MIVYSKVALPALFKLIFMASKYGYCAEVYGQAFMNRIFYPLWILIVFIMLASFGWNNRIGVNQYFKFSWAFAFIPFILLSIVLYQFFMFAFRLINYVLLGGFGLTSGMIAALVVYIILLISASLYFVSRHSRI